MNFAASRDIIQNTPFPYNSMDRLRLAQQMTMAPQVSQEVQGQGGLAGHPVVQAGFGGFLRKIAPIALAIAAPYIAAPLLGTTVAAMGPVATGFALGAGSGLGSLIAGARPKDALKTALLSGVTAGAAKGASNYFAGKTAGADTGSMFDVTRGAPETSSSALVDTGFKSTIPDLDASLRSYAASPSDVSGFTVGKESFLKPIDLAPKAQFVDANTGQVFQQGSSLGDGFTLGGANLAPDSGLTSVKNITGLENIDAARDAALETNVRRAYTFAPKVEVPDAYSVNVPKVQQAFVDTLKTSGAGTTTPTLSQSVGQLFSDIKTNPFGMAGKAALIDMTVPDFEQMYAMEAYNKETQDRT